MTWRYPDKPAAQIGRDALDDLPGNYVAELKMDGWRVVIEQTAGGLTFTTRHKKPCPVSAGLRAKLTGELAGLPVGSIVDGEWLARRPAAREESLWLFDIMRHGSIDLYASDTLARLDVLYDSVPGWLIVPHSLSTYADFFDIMHDERADAEGIVLKRADARYIGSYRECANNAAWLKCKWRAGEDGQTQIVSAAAERFALANDPPPWNGGRFASTKSAEEAVRELDPEPEDVAFVGEVFRKTTRIEAANLLKIEHRKVG